MTDRFTSDATAWISPPARARTGDSRPRRIFGPSRSSSSTRMKIVNSSISSDTAPLPNDRAGLERSCPNVTSLGAFCATHCCTW